MRRTLTALFALSVLLVAGCSDDSTTEPGDDVDSSDSPEENGEEASAGSEGLCSWATVDSVAAVFGGEVEFTGGVECRVDVSGGSQPGLYHFALEQHSGYDQLFENLESNQTASPQRFTICSQEQSTWQGMRTLVAVTCPESGQGYLPYVLLEMSDGRLLRQLPQEHADQASAQAAAEQFLELFKVYVAGLDRVPLINEWEPGGWVEIYNPGDQPLDLSGYSVEWADDGAEQAGPVTAVPAGTTADPRGVVVVVVTGSAEPSGYSSTLRLLDSEGRPADFLAMSSDPGPGEVLRRNGDGGRFCNFESPAVTKGQPNPPAAERCDG